jgi:hypothetical protein
MKIKISEDDIGYTQDFGKDDYQKSMITIRAKNYEIYKKIRDRMLESFNDYRIRPCPIWQCSGELITKDQNKTNNKNDDSDSWQLPDLICNDCKGVYVFKEFKKQRYIDE